MKYTNIVFPENIEARITNRVHIVQRRHAYVKCIGFSIASSLSVVGMVVTISYIESAFTQSGAGQYLGTILSDTSVVTTYWKELAFSVTESLPVFSITLLLTATGIGLWSGMRAITTIKTYDYRHQKSA